jgi:hypothetical protein
VSSIKLVAVEHSWWLTLLLAVCDWSNSHPGCCTHRNNSWYHWARGWLGPTHGTTEHEVGWAPLMVPLSTRLDGPHSWYHWARGWLGPTVILCVLEKRKTWPLSERGTSDFSVHRLVTILIMLAGIDIKWKIKLKVWYYEWIGNGKIIVIWTNKNGVYIWKVLLLNLSIQTYTFDCCSIWMWTWYHTLSEDLRK